MKLRNYFLVFCVFALLVLLVSCLSNDKSPDIRNPKVETPSLQMNPDRKFNTGPILVTLATTTADAKIYYTLDGSAPGATNGTLYTGPFNLTADDTDDASYRGYIVLRAIGTKENYPDSELVRHEFQIFTPEGIKNSSGKLVTGGPETGEGVGYNRGRVAVTLELDNGKISNIAFTGPGQTAAYWAAAVRYAEEFFKEMNTYDFVPVVSGASLSGNGIRTAAKDAIDKILDAE